VRVLWDKDERGRWRKHVQFAGARRRAEGERAEKPEHFLSFPSAPPSFLPTDLAESGALLALRAHQLVGTEMVEVHAVRPVPFLWALAAKPGESMACVCVW